MSEGSGPLSFSLGSLKEYTPRITGKWRIKGYHPEPHTRALGSRVELLHFCSESREVSEDVTTCLLFHPGFTYKEGAVKRQTGLLITHIWSL